MRRIWHQNSKNFHLEFISRARFNIKKMITPPKNKSPWEAMTAGSTGGWAAGLEPLGPVVTGAVGALGPILAPFTGGASLAIAPLLTAGMGAAGMAGGGTGFQGTDEGIVGNLLPTLGGAAAGYGLGAIGSSVGSGLQSFAGGMPSGASSTFTAGQTAANAGTWGQGALGTFGSGLAQGASNFLGTPIIPGIAGSSGTGIASGIGNMLNPATPPRTNTIDQVLSNASKGITGTADMASGGNAFNLSNIAKLTLGATAAAGMAGGAPTLEANPAEAMKAVSAPNLVEARKMIKDLAFASPDELTGPASDEFINASLRQTRAAFARTRQQTINTYSASGKVLGKSSAVDNRLAQMDREQIQRESDWIVGVNEARATAAIAQKIKAVQNYYNVSMEEAGSMLAAENYVNNVDLQNYYAQYQTYNQNAQTLGYVAGSMLR